MAGTKKGLVRPVHLLTLIFLVGYFLLSNVILVGSLANSSIYLAFLIPVVFGVTSTFVFLYLFGHEDFFHFITKFEEEEKEKEDKYIVKFKKYGRWPACICVSAIGGPVFLALTVRLLFEKRENRYMVGLISTLASTIFLVAAAKGFLKVAFG